MNCVVHSVQVVHVTIYEVITLCLCTCRRRRRPTKYFIDHRPPGDVAYQPGMYTKEQPDMVPRTPICANRGQSDGPEHSHYTHVWELRSAPKPQGDTNLAGIHKEKPLALRSFLGHGHHGQHRREHIYESPKFERCPGCPHPTLPRDPRDPAFFHVPHAHHPHPHTPQSPIDHTHKPQTTPHMGHHTGQGHVSPSHVVPIHTHVTTPPGHMTNNPAPFKTDDVIMTSDDSDDDIGRCEIRFSKGVGYRPVPVGSKENKPKAIKAT